MYVAIGCVGREPSNAFACSGETGLAFGLFTTVVNALLGSVSTMAGGVGTGSAPAGAGGMPGGADGIPAASHAA